MEEKLEQAIEEAARVITRQGGPPIIAFTGAGISVESGIPDFRSLGGLWTKYDPSLYCNYLVFQERPDLFWSMAVEMHESMSRADPNPAHYALAELEKLGLLSSVVTQNVDNLHQRAGSMKVYELHGSGATSSCLSCKEKYSTDDLIQKLQLNKELKFPTCQICGGVVKMDVILFGESLPNSVMKDAVQSAVNAKAVLVVGTSLAVSPANNIVSICKRNGSEVMICDPNPASNNEELADIMLWGNAGDVLPRLVSSCKSLLNSKSPG